MVNESLTLFLVLLSLIFLHVQSLFFTEAILKLYTLLIINHFLDFTMTSTSPVFMFCAFILLSVFFLWFHHHQERNKHYKNLCFRTCVLTATTIYFMIKMMMSPEINESLPQGYCFKYNMWWSVTLDVRKFSFDGRGEKKVDTFTLMDSVRKEEEQKTQVNFVMSMKKS